jgi:DNA mismatch repair ATPase MutS
MHVDPITLADLEVLVARDGGPGILDMVDSTRTRVGRQALQRRLTRPLGTVEEIRAVQAALPRLIGPHPIDHITEEAIQRTERYIGSNVLPSRGVGGTWARLAELWMRMRYPAVLTELREGQVALRELTAFGRRLASRLLSDAPPSLLRGFGERLADRTSEVDRALSSGPILNTDRIVREDLREEVLEIIGILGELDALRSMALAGEARGWVRPELVDSPDFLLEAEGAYHPFLTGAHPNPIALNGGEPLVFLTGPNMAGKTTYLKTAGLLVLLAQTGMDVPASAVRLAPIEVLFTSLDPADNLRDGISYFYAEILRVREAAEILAEGRTAMVLFDEVFKGTNVKDAIEASAQVIRGFARTRRSGSIFSSHLYELFDTLRTDPAVRFCQFDGEVVGGVPVFDYKLASGVSEKRFGLLLLEQARIPELIARITA